MADNIFNAKIIDSVGINRSELKYYLKIVEIVANTLLSTVILFLKH